MLRIGRWTPVAGLVALIWNAPVLANSSSSPMIVFSRSSSNTLYSSTWSGSAWGSVSSVASVGANAHYVVLRNCPTRNETACLAQDTNYDVNVLFHNGSSWSSPVEISSDVREPEDRNCDLAYEQSSGDCLIVYYDGSEGNFGYRTYNGTSLSSETDLTLSGLNESEMIMLYPKPESNQIMMVVIAITSAGDPAIYARLWNGSSWGSWSTIETSGVSNDDECAAFAWETDSGDGLIVYGESGSSSPRYRTFNGTSWSSESSLPSTGATPYWIRLVADPASDEILFGGLDSSLDLNVNAWNGSSWGTNSEVETNMMSYSRREFDIAYEGGGGRAVMCYVEKDTNRLRYRTRNTSNWSNEQTGVDLGDTPQIVQLQTGFNAGEVFIAATDAGNDIELIRWNGSSMSSKTRIEDNSGGAAHTENFMISVPTAPTTTPADIPYFNDFQSGNSWAEWSNSTNSSNTTYTKFLGRFNNSSVDLALNTTIGETYTITFDLYCNDSWDGTGSGGSGPDYFVVEAGGVESFRFTFGHNNLTHGVTYPYPYDQIGAYAYDSSDNDAIYRTVEAVFTATASVTTITFSAELTGDIDDESWGIDNVSVKRANFLNVSSSKSFNVNTSSNADNYGSGILWADFDNDGDLDAVMTGNTAKLMINNNAGSSFTNVYGSTSVYAIRQGALLDADNDGDVDIWLAGYSSGYDNERLFVNVGGSSYFGDGGAAGFNAPTANEGVAAADVDDDGWCDLVVFGGTSGNFIGHNQKSSSPSFTGTTSSSYGMNGSGDYGNGDYCSSADVNNDGLLDFFFNYNSGRLFVSDGDGTYTRNNYSISVTLNDKAGSAWGDYDNDGDMDLFVPRIDEGYTGTLWRNDRNWTAGTGNFTNVTSSAGISINSSIDYTPDNPGMRSACWGDYDNDGDLDLLIIGANGNPYLYQNQDDGTFDKVGEGITYSGAGIDGMFVDYDNDGDLDVAITRESASAMLFENRTTNANYLKVGVIGQGSGRTNKAGVGTRVELWNSSGSTLLAVREVGVARGYGGTEPLWAHFGGVTPSTTYKVKVKFASGTVSTNIVPNSTSTTIGSRTISKMFTLTEDAKARIIKWREVIN